MCVNGSDRRRRIVVFEIPEKPPQENGRMSAAVVPLPLSDGHAT